MIVQVEKEVKSRSGVSIGLRMAVMSKRHAAGTFEITMNPQPPYDATGAVILNRISISKVFHGELEGLSSVEMLSAMPPVKGSAGYVALEHVRGKLHGRAGGFVLQHSGTMTRGKPELKVSVVPDSGTGELVGLSGLMVIEIVDGQHRYTFDYQLEPAAG
jgi:Protein of unknown function (DUF3224)